MVDGNVANVDAGTFHSAVVADHLHQIENRGEESPVVLRIGIWVGGHLQAVKLDVVVVVHTVSSQDL